VSSDQADVPTLTGTPAHGGTAELERELEAASQRPNGRLLPEREIAERYQLTRAAVRRWLLQLEQDGRVTRHVGRGTFVTPPVAVSDHRNGRGHLDTSPAEIMAVRLLMEPEILPLAVANATVSDIEEMRRCLVESEASATFQEFERWDARLHAVIANSSRNRLLVKLFSVMNEAREHPLWGSAKERSFTPERRKEYECDHRELVAAIADRDPAAAAALMRRHLRRIEGALIRVEAEAQG
jgi:GntR family uxuAB operon transcriptional repressor